MYGAASASKLPLKSVDEASALLPEMTPDRRREFAKRRADMERKKLNHNSSTYGKIFQSAKALDKGGQQGATLGGREQSGGGPPIAPKRKHKYSFIYTMLNPHSRQLPAVVFKRFITLVIIVDLILFVLSTDPHLFRRHSEAFYAAEAIASTIFLFEYILRFITCVEARKYKKMGPIQGRLAYMITTSALIDLASALPFFVELQTGWNLPTLTYIRFFRLFRILKTEGFIVALDAVYRVIWYNREILWVSVILCVFLILVTSVLLYYCRPQDPEDAADFKSIAATMFLSTMMLTGQGGPSGDLPWYTKSVVVLTSVFSVAMFAIPASILVWGFEAEAERMARRQRKRVLLQRNASSIRESSTSEEDLDTTDEEYFKIIAGEELDGDEGAPEDPLTRKLREAFENADTNMDGTLTLSEFIRLSASDTGSIQERVDKLEAQAVENAQKLDLIISMMQKK